MHKSIQYTFTENLFENDYFWFGFKNSHYGNLRKSFLQGKMKGGLEHEKSSKRNTNDRRSAG